MYISSQPVWLNNFNHPVETSLRADYENQLLKLSGGIASHNIVGLIYYDTLARPQQETAPVVVFQAYGKTRLDFWKLHFEGEAVYQKSSSDKLRFPDLSLKGTLWISTRFFTSELRIGLTARYNSAWYAMAYMPLTQQFYLQDKQRINNYPLVDGFISAKVKRFRFFLNYENPLQGIYGRGWYASPNYPLPLNLIRWGVSWYLGN
jgi:hypothetical protein